MQEKQEIASSNYFQHLQQFYEQNTKSSFDKISAINKKRNQSQHVNYNLDSNGLQNKASSQSITNNSIKCKTQQRAKSVLLEESQTDRQYQKIHEVLKQNSKTLPKVMKKEIFARSQQNRINSSIKEEEFIKRQKNLIHTNNIREQKNILNSYCLESKGKFWNQRYKMRSQSSEIINNQQKMQNIHRKKKYKQSSRFNPYTIVISAPQFGVILPRQKSFNKTKKWKQFQSKKKQLKSKQVSQNNFDPKPFNLIKKTQTLSLQAKKIMNPRLRTQNLSVPMKMEEKVSSFINAPNKQSNVLKNQNNNLSFQFKNQCSSRQIIIGFSNRKFLHKNDRNKSQENIENNFCKHNLQSIFKRLKSMKTKILVTKGNMQRQDINIQSDLLKQSRRLQNDQNDLIDKLSQQRYKIIKNNNKLKSSNRLKYTDTNQKEENLHVHSYSRHQLSLNKLEYQD